MASTFAGSLAERACAAHIDVREEAGYVTGATFDANGGLLMR